MKAMSKEDQEKLADAEASVTAMLVSCGEGDVNAWKKECSRLQWLADTCKPQSAMCHILLSYMSSNSTAPVTCKLYCVLSHSDKSKSRKRALVDLIGYRYMDKSATALRPKVLPLGLDAE